MPDPRFPDDWTMVVHVVGCKGVAFYLSARPRPGTRLVAELARYPDGSRPRPGSPSICGSCGEAVELGELSIPPLAWKPGDPVNVRRRG